MISGGTGADQGGQGDWAVVGEGTGNEPKSRRLMERARYLEKRFEHLTEMVVDEKTGHRRLRHLTENGQYDQSVLPDQWLIQGQINIFCAYRDGMGKSSDIITSNCTDEK